MGPWIKINKIFTAQKKAVRAIENKYNNFFYNSETGESPCHTKEIFTRNNFLTVHNLIAKNCLVAMHKIYLDTTPAKISSLFQSNKNINRDTRRDPLFFNVPYSRLVAPDKTMPIKGPKFYNSVVNDLTKNQVSVNPERKFLDPFKKIVSSYLNTVQAGGGIEWGTENFPLFKI